MSIGTKGVAPRPSAGGISRSPVHSDPRGKGGLATGVAESDFVECRKVAHDGAPQSVSVVTNHNVDSYPKDIQKLILGIAEYGGRLYLQVFADLWNRMAFPEGTEVRHAYIARGTDSLARLVQFFGLADGRTDITAWRNVREPEYPSQTAGWSASSRFQESLDGDLGTDPAYFTTYLWDGQMAGLMKRHSMEPYGEDPSKDSVNNKYMNGIGFDAIQSKLQDLGVRPLKWIPRVLGNADEYAAGVLEFTRKYPRLDIMSKRKDGASGVGHFQVHSKAISELLQGLPEEEQLDVLKRAFSGLQNSKRPEVDAESGEKKQIHIGVYEGVELVRFFGVGTVQAFESDLATEGMIIQEFLPGVTPRTPQPSYQGFVSRVQNPDGSHTNTLSVADQLVNPHDKEYEGAVPISRDAAYYAQVEGAGQAFGEWLHEIGYTGQFGVDFIVVNGEVVPCEANVRPTGAFPLYLAMNVLAKAKLNDQGKWVTEDGIQKFGKIWDPALYPGLRGLEDDALYEVMSRFGLLWDQERGSGVVPINPPLGSVVGKVPWVVVANTEEEVEAFHQRSLRLSEFFQRRDDYMPGAGEEVCPGDQPRLAATDQVEKEMTALATLQLTGEKTPYLRAAGVSPDRKKIATVSNHRDRSEISVCSLVEGERVCQLSTDGFQYAVNQVKWTSDHTVAAALLDGTVVVWDVPANPTDKPVEGQKIFVGIVDEKDWTRDTGLVRDMAGEGRWFGCASTNGTVRFIDREANEAKVWNGADGFAHSICYVPEMEAFAVGDDLGVKLVDPKELKELRSIPLQKAVVSMDVHPRKRLAAFTSGHELYIIDLDEPVPDKAIKRSFTHLSRLKEVQFSPDGEFMSVLDVDGRVSLYDLGEGVWVTPTDGRKRIEIGQEHALTHYWSDGQLALVGLTGMVDRYATDSGAGVQYYC